MDSPLNLSRCRTTSGIAIQCKRQTNYGKAATHMSRIHIVGSGLAGSEAAYFLAEQGFEVILHEMRPEVMTPAHKTDRCAELVCSNSFKSKNPVSAPGMLKD